MKKLFVLSVLSLIATMFLARGFAGEAKQYISIESTGITETAQRSYIYSADGTVLTRLYLENREDTPLKNIPEHVQRAFIAIEDERYYKHHGVDYQGILRAFMNNLKNRRIVEGGSTITQQYVKNSLGETDRTMTRKIREAIIASRLDEKYTKKQILEAYLNTIYFGHGAYGIQAASEVYFGKNARDLTLAEGALLAGVTKAPLNFSPYYQPDKAFKRQAIVLDHMAKLGLITKAGAEDAKKSRPRLAALKQERVIAPYFVEYVKKMLIDKYGVDKVFKGGLRVYTTLNLKAQYIAEGAIARNLYLKKDPQAALVSINPKNGHVIAMVGGRDFNHVKYNLATQGKRQPGSSFKPFVLITALKQGIRPEDTFNSSSPQAIRFSSLLPPWIVHNCEGHGYGMMTLREATTHSVNAVYANLTMKVGAKEVVKTAKLMGITTPIRPFPAIGIGGLTVGVTPLEMASAYGTIANSGIHVKPNPIIKIVDSKGKVIMRSKYEVTRAMNSNVAHQAIDIMKSVIERGTATRANIGRPAAGKTGTNGQYRDAWFVGFTPNLATSVWMGYPEGQISMYNVHGSRGFGGIIPATIWRIYMSAVLKHTPVVDFPGFKQTARKSSKEDTSTASEYSRSSRSTRYSNKKSSTGENDSSLQNQTGSNQAQGQQTQRSPSTSQTSPQQINQEAPKPTTPIGTPQTSPVPPAPSPSAPVPSSPPPTSTSPSSQGTQGTQGNSNPTSTGSPSTTPNKKP